MHLIRENMDEIDWFYLSSNPSAISMLEQNRNRIDKYGLAQNPNIFKLEINMEIFRILFSVL